VCVCVPQVSDIQANINVIHAGLFMASYACFVDTGNPRYTYTHTHTLHCKCIYVYTHTCSKCIEVLYACNAHLRIPLHPHTHIDTHTHYSICICTHTHRYASIVISMCFFMLPPVLCAVCLQVRDAAAGGRVTAQCALATAFLLLLVSSISIVCGV
jgi:hypothetical protein